MNFDFTRGKTARFFGPYGSSFLGIVALALAAALASAPAEAAAKSQPERQVSAAPSGPLLAVVSIGAQRLSVYDKSGQILTSRVSSGRTGYETPQGVFAIIERNREHFSNLYDDAPMPNMQRITWSGVAMHAGKLPGYPASHGCIRLPHDVSARLFELTKLGTRVVVTDGDTAPVAIEHPHLFTVRATEGSAPANGDSAKVVDAMSLPRLMSAVISSPAHAAAIPSTLDPTIDRPAGMSRAAFAAELTAKAQRTDAAARTAKATAVAALKVADRAMNQVLVSERTRSALAAKIDELDRLIERGRNSKAVAKAETTKALASVSIVALLAETDRLRTVEEQKRSEAARLAVLAEEAAIARTAAGTLARDANRRLKPVSVFVSRKSGRLYVRQGFEPVFDVPVAIRDQAAPIGTHVFTALDTKADGIEMQWSAVTAVGATSDKFDVAPVQGRRRAIAQVVSVSDPKLTAAAALERLEITDHVRQRIGEMLSPGSSLIVSDHGISTETGKGTDFVILTK